jgi:hypothetical protein
LQKINFETTKNKKVQIFILLRKYVKRIDLES